MAKDTREDLSKRGKVGQTYRSGSFAKAKKKGLKTADLSKKQLQRAQTVRGRKVSKKQVAKATKKSAYTSISDTQFEKGKGVTKGGKLFTGTVTLASGKKATYVKGRRVVAGKKAPAKPARSRGGSGSRTTATAKRNIPTTRVSPSARGEGAGRVSRTPSRRTPDGAYDSHFSLPRNKPHGSVVGRVWGALNSPRSKESRHSKNYGQKMSDAKNRRRQATWITGSSRGRWNPTTRKYEK